MPGETPPIPAPVKTLEAPLPTGTPPGEALNVDPIASAAGSQDQPHAVPIDVTNQPPTAESIPNASSDSAYKQVMGWVGRIDLDLDPEAIIEMANRIEGRPKIAITPENIGIVHLAKKEASRRMAEEAKAKLEAAANAPKTEQPQEETHEQITNRISEAWKKGTVLLGAEADANLWDENAQGLSPDDKAIRVAARRTKRIWSEIKIYQGERVRLENERRQGAGEQPLSSDAQKAFEEQVIGELKIDPSKLMTKQCKYDKDLKVYIFYDTTRTKETDKFSQAELTKPVIAGLKNIADQKGQDGKPTPQATEAQGVLVVLEKYQKGDSFPARTESELAAELAHKEIFEAAYQTIAYYLGKDIADALVAGSTDKYDITLVLDRIKKNPNMALADLATTIYVYHHGGAKNNPAVQGNIDASLYYQLQGLTEGLNAEKPELGAKIKNLESHDGLMKKRFENARTIIQDFLIRDKIQVSDKNILRILTMSTFFEGQTEITQQHGLRLTGEAHEIVLGLRQKGLLTADDELAITHLAHDKAGSGLYSTLYGVDIKALTSGKSVGEISTFVIDELIKQNNPEFKLTEAQRAIAEQILKAHMTETGLQRLRNLNIPPGAGMGIIMLAMLLPMLQGLMDTGNESGGGGGHGQQG